ncbi:unannotated protein [freshwater metagenome]|uniref:Unannotated protein n=1 Tax=freshwater metagenome TaxID=449393 RepID=A0A6J7N0J8_9ZZZZ
MDLAASHDREDDLAEYVEVGGSEAELLAGDVAFDDLQAPSGVEEILHEVAGDRRDE